MSEIRIDLELKLSIPDKELNVNSIVFLLKKSMGHIAFKILDALLYGIEVRVISGLQENWSGRYVCNGDGRNWRQFRAASVSVCPALSSAGAENALPLEKGFRGFSYRRILEESIEPAVGLAVHLSYRGSGKEIERIKGASMAKSGLHRGLQEFSRLQCQ